MSISYARLILFNSLTCIIITTNTSETSRSSTNIQDLCTLVKKLQQKDILDGEVYIAQNNNVILHEWSKEVASCAPDGKAQFLIGSISKQFTAVALLNALYTKNDEPTEFEKCNFVRTQLHKPLSNFLPVDHSVWNNSMPEWTNKVTLHHLLTHTAGIPGSIKITFDQSGFDGIWNRLSTPHTVAEVMSISTQEPLMFDPGTSYAYSNEGYMLLAEVITKLSDTSFAQYIENLCKSIEMNDTRCLEYGNWKQIKKQYCPLLVPEQIYSVINPKTPLTEPATNMCYEISNARGSGGIISTIQDLIKWNTALHKTDTLLPKQLYTLFITPNLKDYGYGIKNKQGILCHNGKIGSYFSDMLYIPEKDLLIIMLCNVDYDETIEKTACLLEEVLKKSIVNDTERREFINKTLDDLVEKYPATRGAEYLRKFEITNTSNA